MEIQKNILEDIANCFHKNEESIAVAESVTSGFLQFSFSQMDKASDFFRGGITAYSLGEKVRLLEVNQLEAKSCNCVSEKISQQMAVGVSKLFRTDWGIGVTGYAVPVPESDDKLFAYFSFAYYGEIIFTKKLELDLDTVGKEAQLYYSEFILGCLKCELNKLIANKCTHSAR
ncbi:damage-inducible protein CinA [Chryseobacterium sp. Leaf180]|uniref:CinA family protein n=1 Tax=Chryseobacterium sp. Leaf180 TaxID=1736289 RepID=UPI0006FF1C8C|nr:nicotinamide-nucleotide amidohydrolase family protein [Chryseobacterium sp. Leaf180]KQR95667.1 damage-inducible protein CinA [Chryseobacterium sp. Leaf180]